MPYNGWTIAHLRLATHGAKLKKNTHPFVAGDWAIVHNGIFGYHEMLKKVMCKFGAAFSGETDSEVAAYTIAAIGPKAFLASSKAAGAYLGLRRNGDLWAFKNSGDMDMLDTKYGPLIASNLGMLKDKVEVDEGWMHYSSSCKLIAKEYTEKKKWGGYSFPYTKTKTIGFETGSRVPADPFKFHDWNEAHVMKDGKCTNLWCKACKYADKLPFGREDFLD